MKLLYGGIKDGVHLSASEITEVAAGGAAKSSAAIVEIDAYRIRSLIGGNQVGVAVAIQIGGGEGIHSRLAAKDCGCGEVAGPVAELNADRVTHVHGIVGVRGKWESRADKVELSVAVNICQEGRARHNAGAEDAGIRDVECPIAFAWEEGGDVLRVEGDRIDAAIAIDIAKRHGGRRRPQGCFLVGRDIEKELLVIFKQPIALVEIDTRAGIGHLVFEAQPVRRDDAVVEGHDVWQSVAIQVRGGNGERIK